MPNPLFPSVMQSPIQAPMPPPSKKQRGPPPSASSSVASGEDAAALRRKQLQDLMKQQQQATKRMPTSSRSLLLARGRAAMTNGTGQPPPTARTLNGTAPPPVVPNPKAFSRTRHSDIFPSVPSDEKKNGPQHTIPLIEEPPIDDPPPADVLAAAVAPPQDSTPASTQVARRLEQAFAQPVPDPTRMVAAARASPLKKNTTARPSRPGPINLMDSTISDNRKKPPPAPAVQSSPPPPAAAPKPTLTTTPPASSTAITTTTTAPPNGTTAPSSRREFLSTMVQYVDSPKDQATSPQMGLVRELKKAHQEKEDAFRQIVRLREQMQNKTDLDNLVKVAETQGEEAAIEWAKSQVKAKASPNDRPKVSFMTPMRRATSPSRRGMSSSLAKQPAVRKRVLTPHPKRQQENGDERPLLAQATKTNPDEFESVLALYIVRRPYEASNHALWNDIGVMSESDYQATSNVGKPSSIEICAKVKADGSTLVLSGGSNVRHKKPRGKQWRSFDNVDDRDKPMGSVMYIDAQAIEGEYWLDEIYEEALSTRDTYCSSLISTASALKAGLMASVPVPIPQTTAPSAATAATTIVPSPPKVDVGVSTDPIDFSPQSPVMPPAFMGQQPQQQQQQPPPEGIQQPRLQQQPPQTIPLPEQSSQPAPEGVLKTKDAPKKPKEKKKEEPPEEEEEHVTDAFSMFLAIAFTSMFSILYFVLVTLPLRALKISFIASIAGVILSIVWAHLAHDNGAGEMGASLGYGFNRPGIV